MFEITGLVSKETVGACQREVKLSLLLRFLFTVEI